MGFDVTKKAINTDLNEPLNYYSWIQDFLLYGKDSHVANNLITLNELTLKSNAFKKHAHTVPILAELPNHVGMAFANIYNLNHTVLDSHQTIDSIINNTTAFTEVGNDLALFEALLSDNTIMNKIITTNTSMNIVCSTSALRDKLLANNMAMSAVRLNNAAMTKLLSGIVNVSPATYANLNALFSNATDFGKIVINTDALSVLFGSMMARSALHDNTTASNTILANATSRAWMVANVAIETAVPAQTQMGSYNTSIQATKAFGLGLKITVSSANAIANWWSPSRSVSGGTANTYQYLYERLTNFMVGTTLNSNFGSQVITTALWIPMSA